MLSENFTCLFVKIGDFSRSRPKFPRLYSCGITCFVTCVFHHRRRSQVFRRNAKIYSAKTNEREKKKKKLFITDSTPDLLGFKTNI